MFKIITSIFDRFQNQNTELVLIEENHDKYADKGMQLIEPYVILLGKSPRSDKNKETRLLEGIRYLDAVSQINPDNFGAFWFKGKAYQALNQHEQAYQAFEKSFELNKQNPDVARELMLECLDLGKGQRAVEVALHALGQNKKDTGLIANLALAYLFNADLDLASKTIGKAIAAAPSDQINQNVKKIIDEVISGKRPQPKKHSDLKR